jgi:hypothetical protein
MKRFDITEKFAEKAKELGLIHVVSLNFIKKKGYEIEFEKNITIDEVKKQELINYLTELKLKEILVNRCESNGTNYYYFQGFCHLYNFEHKKNIVNIFKNGELIKTIKTSIELTEFINLIPNKVYLNVC